MSNFAKNIHKTIITLSLISLVSFVVIMITEHYDFGQSNKYYDSEYLKSLRDPNFRSSLFVQSIMLLLVLSPYIYLHYRLIRFNLSTMHKVLIFINALEVIMCIFFNVVFVFGMLGGGSGEALFGPALLFFGVFIPILFVEVILSTILFFKERKSQTNIENI